MIKEFKPALLFLGKFLIVYFVGNLIYGLAIEYVNPRPDGATRLVAANTCAVLKMFSAGVSQELNPSGPTVFLKSGHIALLSIYEGCNGLNVMIVFVAFIVAYGGSIRKAAWFVPAGLITLHIFNLFRISLLFVLAEDNSSHFYYFHKYFFTAILYLVTFGLWAVWIKMVNAESGTRKTSPVDKT